MFVNKKKALALLRDLAAVLDEYVEMTGKADEIVREIFGLEYRTSIGDIRELDDEWEKLGESVELTFYSSNDEHDFLAEAIEAVEKAIGRLESE